MLTSSSLFALLWLAIGTTAEIIDLSTFTKVDWQSLIDLSFDQGVAAVAVDGLQRNLELSAESLELALDSPELEDLKYEWFGEVFACEEEYNKYVEDIACLAKTYSEARIEMMVLKGYGLPLNYPVPAHRPVGDVDIFLNDNDDDNDDCGRLPAWRRGDEVIRRKGIAIDYSHHHHSVFSWRGQMVENHYDIVNRCTGKSGRMEDDMFTLLHISRATISPCAICWIGLYS